MAAPANGKGKDASNSVSAAAREAGHKWSDLFKSTSKPSSSFKLQKWNESEREITKDELRNLGHCLVGYILGRFPGLQAIDAVRRSWQVENNISIHDSGWIIFSFRNENDRDSVLEKGPYETLGCAWILKKLPQYFRFEDECFTSIPTWIRLHGLPLEFWSVNALGKIASSIGEPIAADECTALMSKSSFARILVEVDVTKPLTREVRFAMPNGSICIQKVVYEREPRWCSHCRILGHLVEDCRRKNARKPESTGVQKQPQKLVASVVHSISPADLPPTVPPQPPALLSPVLAQVPVMQHDTGESSRMPSILTKENPPSTPTGGSIAREASQLGCSVPDPISPSTSHSPMSAGSMEMQKDEDDVLLTENNIMPCNIMDLDNQDSPIQLSNGSSAEALKPTMNTRSKKKKTKGKGKAR